MKQHFSIRGHKAPISCIAGWNLDLVSADRDGWVVVWNLTTRRPRALWKAHDGHILTLKQTPHGLLTHGRDSSLRLWKMDAESLRECSADGSLLGSNLSPSGPPHVEIPVNALNFSNVDFFGEYLATPATVDSDNLDVYRIRDPFGEFSFSRILENVAISSVHTKTEAEESNGHSEVEEINGPSGLNASEEKLGRGGHGIIMQLKFISETLFFVAYESGAVFGLAIENVTHDKISPKSRLVLPKPCKVTKVFLANDHKPQPVLSLEYDQLTQCLFTGSASKKLHIYNLKHLTSGSSTNGELSDIETHNLRHYGIQCLQVLPDRIIIGFWDGVVRGYSKTFEELFLLVRAEESIKPAFIGNQAPNKKSVCIYSSDLGRENDQIVKSRKEALHSKRLGTNPSLFVGYGDGLITAFK